MVLYSFLLNAALKKLLEIHKKKKHNKKTHKFIIYLNVKKNQKTLLYLFNSPFPFGCSILLLP